MADVTVQPAVCRCMAAGLHGNADSKTSANLIKTMLSAVYGNENILPRIGKSWIYDYEQSGKNKQTVFERAKDGLGRNAEIMSRLHISN